MRKRTSFLRESWARLDSARSLVLACHQNPDGDTLGSALALARVLRSRGKDVVVICEDGVPDNLSFIPEAETVVKSTDRRDFDVGVLIDCEGIKRPGSAAKSVQSAGITACIDHHVPDDSFGDLRVVDQTASSTAEVVFELFEANGVEIDHAVAQQLMTGLVSDTGGFKFANTSPRTFRVAARLAELGADASFIAREIYESRSLTSMKLLGRALDSLRTDQAGQVVWATITRRDLDELGASDADTDSVVNYVGQVKGPRVAVLFREVKPDSIRISLRSRGGVDVNQVARAFGGGGHAAAAGCTIASSLDDARKKLLDEVTKWIAS